MRGYEWGMCEGVSAPVCDGCEGRNKVQCNNGVDNTLHTGSSIYIRCM